MKQKRYELPSFGHLSPSDACRTLKQVADEYNRRNKDKITVKGATSTIERALKKIRLAIEEIEP